MSSLIAATFALESRNKNESALSEEWWTTVYTEYTRKSYTPHTHYMYIFLNTADRSSELI